MENLQILVKQYGQLNLEEIKITRSQGIPSRGLKAKITKLYNKIMKQGNELGISQEELSQMMIKSMQ